MGTMDDNNGIMSPNPNDRNTAFVVGSGDKSTPIDAFNADPAYYNIIWYTLPLIMGWIVLYLHIWLVIHNS